jgi:hypothetical protein
LAEILPLESADMMWKKELKYRICSDEHKVSESDFIYYPTFKEEKIIMSNFDIPCWSLTALLKCLSEIKPQEYTFTLAISDGKWGLCCIEYGRGGLWNEINDSPLDACVAMIEKLHELNLL